MKKMFMFIGIGIICFLGVVVSLVFTEDIQKVVTYNSDIETITTKINKSFNIVLNENETIEIIVTRKNDKGQLASEVLISYTVAEGKKQI